MFKAKAPVSAPALKPPPMIPPAIAPPIVSSLVAYSPNLVSESLSSALPVDHCSCIFSPASCTASPVDEANTPIPALPRLPLAILSIACVAPDLNNTFSA